MRRNASRGFTLIELMLTVAIMGLLATISLNEFGVQLMSTKRVEAVTGLGALYTAQQFHYLEHGKYAGTFSELAVEMDGIELSPTSFRGNRYTYQISQPWGEASFYCIATAQLDGDPWPDILEIYEFGE